MTVNASWRGKMTEAILLHNGSGGMPMVRLVPDATSPRMWRMHWPDGRISDMGDLTRIRELAVSICESGPPARNRQSFKWTRVYRSLQQAITETQARSERAAAQAQTQSAEAT